MSVTARSRRLALALAAPALFLVLTALVQLESVRTPLSEVPAAIEGRVVGGGDVPGGAAGAGGFRYWSTWNGSDDNLGRLELGPFPAPPRFGLLVRGYPGIGHNSLTVENIASGETLALASSANPGESWAALDIEVPPSWRGVPLRIVAHDRAAEWGGWMAISVPFVSPWWACWWSGFLPRLALFVMVGLGVVVVAAAARLWLARVFAPEDERTAIVACGVAGALSYAVFWLHFADSATGRISAWAILAAAAMTLLVHALRQDVFTRGSPRASCDAWAPAALAAALGLGLFAALHLQKVETPIAQLAATRLGSLPADNGIPQVFADHLLQELSPKRLFGDWLSSDRPPLQSGWQLLFARPLLSLHMDFGNAMQCAGIWFQLVWVPAAWAWLRRMGLSPARTAAVVLAATPCTVIFMNTVFVWPKLGGAGFLIGAFTCWVPFRAPEPPRRTEFALGGMLAGLAWVSHGGIAFALLPLGLLVAFRLRQSDPRGLLLAAAVFAFVTLPWSAYQRFYEPPGNRLLKWHLAGQIAIDERGTLQTLRDAYAKASPEELLAARRANLATVFRGEWRELVTFTARDVDNRRAADSTYTFFALGWWNLGWLAAAALSAVPYWRRRLDAAEARGLIYGIGWALSTTGVWIALMFLPNSALLHQGSYTTPVILLLALAAAILRIHPAALLVVAGAQVIGFVRFTLPSSPASSPLPWRTDSTIVLLVATAAALIVTGLCRRSAGPRSRLTDDPTAAGS